ncbi:hypothetical protein DL765_009316 [Monosporascus sp. GIB2]|nr:hypothetical protein DL765_009316 [Monosporascus sp. GIB2]
MTEVVPVDRQRLLESKRQEWISIARSRKRKLRELYAVATTFEGIPTCSFADPDVPITSTGELQFLEASNLPQYVLYASCKASCMIYFAFSCAFRRRTDRVFEVDLGLTRGRKLNESSIPPRPKFRFDVQHQQQQQQQQPQQQQQQQQQSNGVTEQSQTAVLTSSEQDAETSKRPTTLPLPAAVQHAVFEGPSGAASPGPAIAPGFAATPRSSQSPLPSQVPQESTRPIPSPLNNQQSQPKPSPLAEEKPSNAAAHGAAVGLPPNAPALSYPGQAHQTPIYQSQPDARKGDAEGGQHIVGVQTGIGAPSDRTPETTGPLSPLPLPDASRPVDALSSPGSTPRTGTTPAVVDTSANTSPDHEAVQFVVIAQNEGQDGRQETQPEPDQQAQGVVSGKIADTGRATGSVEAQPAGVIFKADSDAALGGGVVSNSMSSDISVPTNPSTSVRSVDQPVATQRTDIQPQAHERPSYDRNNDVFRGSNGLHRALQPLQSPTSTENPPAADEQSMQIAKAYPVPLTPSVDHREASQQIVSTPSQPPSATSVQLDHETLDSSITGPRQKSVAEVLAENPKPLPMTVSTNGGSNAGPITPVSQSSKTQSRSLIRKAKSKERSKMSTVVFGRQSRSTSDSTKSLVQNRSKTSDDYFTPLFIHSFTMNSKWMKPLDQILHHAHKTISTPDSYTPILDHQACRVLRSVYNLQQHNKWSLRQPKRWPEPTRQPSHWDQVLKEMKWMRTDFREERKWKMAAARNLANACAEWYRASVEDRKALQVNAVSPPISNGDDISMVEGPPTQDPESQPTPELIPSGESDSPMDLEEEPPNNILDAVAPSAIFALQDDDIVFALHQSPTSDRLLEELPMYGSPLAVLKSDLIAPDYDPDASWRRPALPLSKYVEGEMVLAPTQPPRKRSRYLYAQEEDEDEDEVIFGGNGGKQPQVEPENTDVALFRPENKMIRDRLHAGHQFRPPNEYTMPFQTFYECRSYSQWTQSEDDELKSLVREYSYNWSLISSMLASKSMFVSGAERRTPWECFERWVMLEGLPNDMQKTQYFKLWQGRIEAAQQTIRQQNQNAAQQHAQQQQQAGANGPTTPIPRRRPSLPLRVERRRNQKHLTMIDAMRKLAKKRETAIHKQQQAAQLAAMRKQNEAPQPKVTTKTPREYSIMRWERDQAVAERLAERMNQHRQQQENQRKAVLQARAQQAQAAQMAASQNAAQQRAQNNPQMAASHPHAAMARANAPNQIAVNSQARPRMPMHPTPNGTGSPGHVAGGLVPPMQMNGSPQMQMPVVNGQSQMAMPNGQQADVRLLMQAQRIQEQQRQSVQMRQQQAHQGSPGGTPMQNSPQAMRAALGGLNQKNYLNNAQAQAMLASMNGANGSGMSTPPGSGFPLSAGQSASPPPNATLSQQPHQTYVSQLQHIENQIRSSNPNAPQDAVRTMARQLLQNRHNNIAQSAMNAAAGGQGQTAVANGPHQYAQLLRQQQQQQAAAAAAAQAAQTTQGAPRHTSASATPASAPSVPK